MMQNDDFYKTFMTGVRNGTPSIASKPPKVSNSRKIILIVTVSLVVIILATCGILALISRNSGSSDDSSSISDGESEVLDAETSTDEPEETSEPDSARYYGADGGVISFRAECSAESKSYNFYKDNTYEISSAKNEEPTETGTYKLSDGAITLTIDYGPDRIAKITDKKLLDGALALDCEYYDDF